MVNVSYEYAVACCKSLFLAGHTTVSPTNPEPWERHNLSVVGDGYLPECGTRIHLVKEELQVSPTFIDNAIVFTHCDDGLVRE